MMSLTAQDSSETASESTSNANAEALSYITIVGCCLSLCGVVVTLLVHGCVASLRHSTPSKLLLGLCTALAMSLSLFIAATYLAASPVPGSCQAVAVLLHYSILASFGWMVVQAANFYAIIIVVMGLRMGLRLRMYNMIAWGMFVCDASIVLYEPRMLASTSSICLSVCLSFFHYVYFVMRHPPI